MKRGIFFSFGVLAVTAACEQEPQQTPFGPTDEPVSVSVPASGGVVTSTAGASVTFPAQALGSSTTVSVTPTTVPPAVSARGEAVSTAFTVGPVDASLNAPVRLDVRMAPGVRTTADAWLTSLVNVNGGQVIPYGNSEVDLATGIVRTSVDQLGTMTLVIPGAGSVVALERQTGTPGAASATLTAGGLAAADVLPSLIQGRCAETPCTDPADRISVSLVAPSGALPSFAQGAVVFWKFGGAFDIQPSGSVSGQLKGDFPVRIAMTPSRPGSYAPVVSVPFRVRLDPTAGTTAISTASEVTLTNVAITLDWGSGTSTHVENVVFTRTTGGGEVVLQRTFTFDGQPIGIRAVVPVAFQ